MYYYAQDVLDDILDEVIDHLKEKFKLITLLEPELKRELEHKLSLSRAGSHIDNLAEAAEEWENLEIDFPGGVRETVEDLREAIQNISKICDEL